MRGWFDAFRDDGGPTLYAHSNRTSVTGDVPTITICLIFLTVYLAFLIIFPGIRKEKFSTFITVTLSLLTGTTICVCNFGSHWEVATSEITTNYRAFSAQRVQAQIGVAIGLDHVNVTYKIIPVDNKSIDIDFNERFYWRTPKEMKYSFKNGLKKGLPYPVLTVAEYFSLDKEGFSWGRNYRQAGYYTTILLWSAFTTWLLANVLLLNVPRYGAYMLMLTGMLMSFACLAFWMLKPHMPLQLRFEDVTLQFISGWSFWMNLVVGCIVVIYGLLISVLDWIYPHKFSTILEVDFDTPYDRHIIIEDSYNTRKRRFKIPKLEEPINAGLHAGSKLLRRLSKRGKNSNEVETNPGVDNPVFEMESPKNGWKPSIMARTDSKKSERSVNFRSSQKSNGFLEIPDIPSNDDKLKHIFQRSDSKQSNSSKSSDSSSYCDAMKRQDSCQSYSSSSSLGLGILTKGPSNYQSNENLHRPVSRNHSGNIIVFHRTDSRGQLQRLSGDPVHIQTDITGENW